MCFYSVTYFMVPALILLEEAQHSKGVADWKAAIKSLLFEMLWDSLMF